MGELVDFSKYQKNVAPEPQIPIEVIPEKSTQESHKILTVKKIEKQKTKPKIDAKPEFNKSIELNSIKTLIANRYGSSTNKRLADMKKALIEVWIEK